MGKSALIIINPAAGKETASSYEEKVKEELKLIYDIVTVKYTEGEGDAEKFAREAGEERADLLVCLGGDGTVNETVNGISGFKERPLLGIIPMGTVNNLAGALNIPDEAEEAIKLLSGSNYKEIDVGLANDRYFTNSLGIGNITEAVYDVEADEKTKFGPLAYVMAVGKEILKDDVFPVRLQMQQGTWEGEISVIIIALLDSIAGLKSVASDVEIGDGKMHIFAVEKLNISNLIAITPRLITGSIEDSKNVKYFQTQHIKINILGNIQYKSSIDGDQGPQLPLEVKVLPRHLRVIIK